MFTTGLVKSVVKNERSNATRITPNVVRSYVNRNCEIRFSLKLLKILTPNLAQLIALTRTPTPPKFVVIALAGSARWVG